MSYVIQNFTTAVPTRVCNQRNQLLFIIRNIYIIIFWIVKKFNFFLTPSISYTNISLLYHLELKLYSKGFTSIFSKIIQKWKFFHTININRSLEYWIFKSGSLFFSSHETYPLSKALCFNEDQHFLNQYYTPYLLSNISLHKKPFRITLFKHLAHILLLWQSWNRHHQPTFRFLLGSQDFYLLYFFNMYIFKVYHL
jgi:hypothetical protein